MDKGIFVNQNRRIIFWGIILFLVAVIDVNGINGLYGNKNHLQLQIESLLPQRKTDMVVEEIRVVIRTNGFAGLVHPEVILVAGSGVILSSGNETVEFTSGEIVVINPDNELFKNGSILVQTREESDKICINSLQRGYGTPSYRGTLELFLTAEGIVIVNELPLEEYLYAVVPSEMPASYELEALKAQAVCARSYAYNQTKIYSYPEYQAHVDDSTKFQVYGNSQEQDSTITAVNLTQGEKLWYNNQVATAYYYSTSSGKSASIQAWGTSWNENNQYLQSVEICDEEGNAYESSLPWYRWTATIPEQTLCNLIELNTGVEIGNLISLSVTKQGDGGIVQEITAVGDVGKIVVATENKIRRALGGSGYTIKKQDGSVINSSELLPSAFFSISKEGENYILSGGGYGHGIGMSQNGANEMAKQGMTYIEILALFYSGATIK